MEKVIEQALQSFTRPDQCKLCDIKLTTAQVAKDHYNSKRHKNSVVIFRKSFKDNVEDMQKSTKQNNSQVITEKPQIKDVPESNMENIIEQTLQSFTEPNQCKLCKVKLINVHVANDHYKSKRHKKSVVIFRESFKDNVNNMHQSKHQVITEKPQNKDVPEKNDDLFCDVCGISTTSKEQIWNHMKGQKHQNRLQEKGISKSDGPYSPFCNNLPKKLKELMLVDECLVCKDTFPTVRRALGHYASPKHDASVKRWFKELKKLEKMQSTSKHEAAKDTDKKLVQNGQHAQKQEQGSSVSNIEKSKVVNKNVLENGQQHAQNQEKIPSTSKHEAVKVSDKKFTNLLQNGQQSEKPPLSFKNRHIHGFPHKDLAKVKSELIKEDIAEEFWSIAGTQLYCNSMLTTSFDLEKHLQNELHSGNSDDWSWSSLEQQDILETDARWHYCKDCNIYLNGTSDAEMHYQTLLHKTIKGRGMYCEVCEVSSLTPELHQLHNTTSKHLEKVAKAEKKAGKDVTQKKLSQGEELPKKTVSITKASINERDETENSIKVTKAASKDVTHINPPEEELPNQTISTTEACDNQTDETENSIKVIVAVPNQSFDLPEETKSEREEILKELDNLMQNLYYSKTVPEQVALDYLRQVNKDVDELMKKPDQPKPKYTYTQEQLLKLRTESTYRDMDSQLRFRINRACLWNSDFNQCDLKASDCPTAVYDYYVGNHFDKYMSFLEDYLQGSVYDAKNAFCIGMVICFLFIISVYNFDNNI